jgi:hypothetical protein
MDTPSSSSLLTSPPAAPTARLSQEARDHLIDLGEARGITLRFLQRMDYVADRMSEDQLRVALADKGQMVLNVARADRALRQIVSMEQEILGLRPVAVPAAGGGSGRSAGGAGRSGGAGAQNNGKDHGGSDVNDLADLNEAQDLQDFEALFDMTDDEDRHAWADIEALERYDSYAEFQEERKFDPMDFDEHDEEELDARIEAELEKYKHSPKVTDLEQRHASIRAIDAQLKAELDAWEKQDEEKWGRRRAALTKLRKTQRALARKGHGPPLAFTIPWPPEGVTPSVRFRVRREDEEGP